MILPQRDQFAYPTRTCLEGEAYPRALCVARYENRDASSRSTEKVHSSLTSAQIGGEESYVPPNRWKLAIRIVGSMYVKTRSRILEF